MRKFESGVFNIYKIVRIHVGGFIIYKNVPQNQPYLDRFLTVSPLITSKNLKIFRALRAQGFYYLQKISALRAVVLLFTKKNLPRFARRFYYLQNLKKQIGGFS